MAWLNLPIKPEYRFLMHVTIFWSANLAVMFGTRDGDIEESRPLLDSFGSTVTEAERSSLSGTNRVVTLSLLSFCSTVTYLALQTSRPLSSGLLSNFGLSQIHPQWSTNLQTQQQTQAAEGVEDSPVIPKAIEEEETICSITTSLTHPSYNCRGSYINFIVPATNNGLWPDGFTWAVYENFEDKKGLLSKNHLEDGPGVTPKSTSCRSFSTVLCLDGDFTLHVNSKLLEPEDKSLYVDICTSDHRVYAGEVYEFSTFKMNCSSSLDNFENYVPISDIPYINRTSELNTPALSKDLFRGNAGKVNEIFDPNPVTDEPEDGTESPVPRDGVSTADYKPISLNEINDPTPISDGEETELMEVGENVISQERDIASDISHIASDEINKESAMLKTSENIGQTADTIKDIIMKNRNMNFMKEINDEKRVADEGDEIEDPILLLEKISNLADSSEQTSSTLLASSSSTVQAASELQNLLRTSTPSSSSYARASASAEQHGDNHSSIKHIESRDGTLNPWSLNPASGSSKVPVAKDAVGHSKGKSTPAPKSQKASMDAPKRHQLAAAAAKGVESSQSLVARERKHEQGSRNLLAKGGVRNISDKQKKSQKLKDLEKSGREKDSRKLLGKGGVKNFSRSHSSKRKYKSTRT